MARAISWTGFRRAGMLLLLAGSTLAFGQARITVAPRTLTLGEFSGFDASGSHLTAGSTRIEVRCDIPWAIYATLLGPPRRASDNLELPLERARQLFPDEVSDFCNYVPVRLDYGSPGGIQTFEYSWQSAQLRLQQYIENTDPPGRYQFSLRMDLRDREGNHSLTDPVEVRIEFVILPYVLVDVPQAGTLLEVPEPGFPADSDPCYITVLSNTAWSLQASCSGEMLVDPGQGAANGGSLMWSVPAGDTWESATPSWSSASTQSTLVAFGHGPLPFELAEAQIPVHLRLFTSRIAQPGSYRLELQFVARTEGPVQ